MHRVAETGKAPVPRESDSETGLYYYRARYYDAASGRFLSEDPIGFKSGLNFYAYTNSNPTGFTDPSGQDFTVTYGPNGININAAITLYGPGATKELAAKWQSYITDFWNNNPGFGGCKVNFNVHVTVDPRANHWFTAHSNPDFPSAAQNYWFVPTTPGDAHMTSFFTGVVPASNLQFAVSHEFAHVLGFVDTNFGNGHVIGDPRDVTAEGYIVTQWDIDAIVFGDWLGGQGPLVKPKCGCK